MKSFFTTLLVILIIAAIGVGGYYYYHKKMGKVVFHEETSNSPSGSLFNRIDPGARHPDHRDRGRNFLDR